MLKTCGMILHDPPLLRDLACLYRIARRHTVVSNGDDVAGEVGSAFRNSFAIPFGEQSGRW